MQLNHKETTENGTWKGDHGKKKVKNETRKTGHKIGEIIIKRKI